MIAMAHSDPNSTCLPTSFNLPHTAPSSVIQDLGSPPVNQQDVIVYDTQNMPLAHRFLATHATSVPKPQRRPLIRSPTLFPSQIMKPSASMSFLMKKQPSAMPDREFKPSPSMSTLAAQHTNTIQDSDVVESAEQDRKRSDSLSCRPSGSLAVNGKVTPLAERRRSQTSRYLGTDDFKSAFAINLLKLKEREQVVANQTGDHLLSKPLDLGCDSTEMGSPQVIGPNDARENVIITEKATPALKQATPCASTFIAVCPSPPDQKEPAPSHELPSMITKDPALQQESHSPRDADRTEEELEARNEVISILASQLSSQMEVNDKLLFELGSLRATYASLQSTSSDYVDELQILKSRTARAELGEAVERTRREAEEKVRDLRHLLEESKRAINRLQLEIRNQGHRRTQTSHHIGLGISSHPSLCHRADRQVPVTLKRSSVSVLCAEHPMIGEASLLKGPTGFPLPPGVSRDEKPTAQFAAGSALYRSPNTQLCLSSEVTQVPSSAKPARPPKSPARPLSLCASSVASDSTVSVIVAAQTAELELMRQKCAQLEAKLTESEDSRMASQAALDGLRMFISSQPAADLPNMKLPPLPSDADDSMSDDSSMASDGDASNHWGIQNIFTRSLSAKVSRTVLGSPKSKPNSATSTPVLGGAFAGFGLWGRSNIPDLFGN